MKAIAGSANSQRRCLSAQWDRASRCAARAVTAEVMVAPSEGWGRVRPHPSGAGTDYFFSVSRTVSTDAVTSEPLIESTIGWPTASRAFTTWATMGRSWSTPPLALAAIASARSFGYDDVPSASAHTDARAPGMPPFCWASVCSLLVAHRMNFHALAWFLLASLMPRAHDGMLYGLLPAEPAGKTANPTVSATFDLAGSVAFL